MTYKHESYGMSVKGPMPTCTVWQGDSLIWRFIPRCLWKRLGRKSHEETTIEAVMARARENMERRFAESFYEGFK